MDLVPFKELSVGCQVKIVDDFLTHWAEDEVDGFEEEILEWKGHILTVKSLKPDHQGRECYHSFQVKENGESWYMQDVEYVVGGFGDSPEIEIGTELPELSSMLFG